MGREGEAVDMPGRQRPSPEILGRLCGLLGVHVDVCPTRVLLSDIQRHPVERAVAPADLGEVLRVSRVAAEEDPGLR